jgi:DNA-binding protein HU-beta
VNRRDLIQAVSTQTGVERRQVDSVLQGFTDVVTVVVSKGEPVSISGFAKFVKVDRPARMGRNPQTQEPVRIKASKKARITPLKGFKDAVVKVSLAPKLERGVWPPAPASAKKASAKKASAKKTSAKKGSAKKASAKKTTARKTSAGRAGARKTTAKKATTKRTTTKRATTRKAPARKTAARKAPARKTTARKSTAARKTTARKTTAARRTAKR